MKIAMLARNPNLYSHKRLVEAAEERGHTLDIINTLRRLHEHHLAPAGGVLQRPEADRLRRGHPAHRCFDNPAMASRLLRQFRDDGRLVPERERRHWPQPWTSCAVCRSWRARGSASRSPPSPMIRNRPTSVLQIAGGAPVVIKLLEGTQGIGVVLGDTERSARLRHRGFPRRQRKHPGAGVHQGSGLHRPARLRGRRQGRGRDDAHRRGRRLPLKPPPRR